MSSQTQPQNVQVASLTIFSSWPLADMERRSSDARQHLAPWRPRFGAAHQPRQRREGGASSTESIVPCSAQQRKGAAGWQPHPGFVRFLLILIDQRLAHPAVIDATVLSAAYR